MRPASPPTGFGVPPPSLVAGSFTIVEEPTARGTFTQALSFPTYPKGTISLAVHVVQAGSAENKLSVDTGNVSYLSARRFAVTHAAPITRASPTALRVAI